MCQLPIFLRQALVILRPIRANDVQTRNQIDLIDMGIKGTCKVKHYRYVLTVEFVFSRFVWHRPLKANLVF